MEGTKTCRMCHKELPIGDFCPAKTNVDGRNNACRPCDNAYRRSKYADGTYAYPPRDERKRAQLKSSHNTTLEYYCQLLQEQEGVCAICKQPNNHIRRSSGTPCDLHVDHDHITGKIRGLLCGKCNMGLGLFMDSTYLLEKAVAYLKQHRHE
jgi:hypothetical protein